MTTTTQRITIDPEFKALIRPLTAEEARELEADIKANGCLSPLLVWDGVLIDGHHRLGICERLGIEFKTKALKFADRTEAKLYILRHQLARRNLSDLDRISIAREMEPLIAEKARERQREAGGDRKSDGAKSLVQKSSQAMDLGKTREEAASLAGVSHDTYTKGKLLLESAPPEILEQVREGKMSINAAHNKIAPEVKTGMAAKIRDFLKDGKWHSATEISEKTGVSILSLRARMSDIRGPKLGAHDVVIKKGSGRVPQYQMNPKENTHQQREPISQRNGRRLNRTFNIKTQDAEKKAQGYKRHLDRGITSLEGLCIGFAKFNVAAALAVSGATEVSALCARLDEAIKTLRDLRARIVRGH